MAFLNHFDALSGPLHEIIGRNLPDKAYVKWRVCYRVKLPGEETRFFFLYNYEDEVPIYLATELARCTGRSFTSSGACFYFYQVVQEHGWLTRIHSTLVVELFTILTQKPRFLQRALRTITLFVRFKLVDHVKFKVWNQTLQGSRKQYACVPLDTFTSIVGPSISKNPHRIPIWFNKYSMTIAQRARMTPWAVSIQAIDPRDYEMEEDD